MAILDIKEGDTVWILPNTELGITQKVKSKVLGIKSYHYNFLYCVEVSKAGFSPPNKEWDMTEKGWSTLVRRDEIYKGSFSDNKFK